MATNEFGKDSQNITVELMKLPSVPELMELKPKEESVNYKVKAVQNDSITLFNIEYKEASPSNEEWSDKNETKGT